MITDEQRLHMITEQLIIVRDNLFRGMSKSMQKLQARSINEVLELPNFTQSPQRTAAEGEDTRRAWVGLTDDEMWQLVNDCIIGGDLHADKFAKAIETKLKGKNTDA